jgi:peptidoglycan biosynthesis protein MviN/MurJ (putative lipid II flippase)
VMMIVLGQLHRGTAWWIEAGLADRVVWLSLSVAAGVGGYFLSLLLFGMRTEQFRMRQG